PIGLELSATTRVPLTASVWLRSLYSEGCNATHCEGSPTNRTAAPPTSAIGSHRACTPRLPLASAAATRPSAAIHCNAPGGLVTYSAPRIARHPVPAPMMSEL